MSFGGYLFSSLSLPAELFLIIPAESQRYLVYMGSCSE